MRDAPPDLEVPTSADWRRLAGNSDKKVTSLPVSSFDQEVRAVVPIADLSSAALLGVLGVVHFQRAIACHKPSVAQAYQLWDWMCKTDGFASWSFMPLHALAAVALVAWFLMSLHGSLGWAWRSLRRADQPGSRADDSSLRQLEIFLATWSACWFAPASPFAASADCADLDPSCPNWASGGECTKNPTFMGKTCALSCKACVKAMSVEWDSLGPRVVTMAAASSLLCIAATRLAMASMSERAQARVTFCARVVVRPLQLTTAVCMRTPFGPLFVAILRILRSALRSCGLLLRLGSSVLGACFDACRRKLIRVLGGNVVDVGDFSKDF